EQGAPDRCMNWQGIRIEIERDIERAKEESEATLRLEARQVPDDPELSELAEVDPRLAIIEGWRMLSDTIDEVARKLGDERDSRYVRMKIEKLINEKKISA